MAKFSSKQIIPAIIAAVVVAVGTIVTGGTATAGLTAGANAFLATSVITVAGAFLAKDRSESNFNAASPTYGFGQWQNRVKGDSVLPVVYTTQEDGHKLAPIWVQAYVTPKGEQDDDFAKVLRAKGQGFSALMAVANGPIGGIRDIRLNDEPIFDEITDREADKKGNGSRRIFKWSQNRIVMKTLDVKVDGVSKGWKDEARTQGVAGDGTIKVVKVDTGAAELSDCADVSVTINGVAVDEDDEHSLRPHIWSANATTLWINTQVPLPVGKTMVVTYHVRVMDGLTVSKVNDNVKANFDTAPASGAVITASYMRRLIPGVRVDWSCGGNAQLALPGYESLRSSNNVGQEITSSVTSFSTTNEVDNIILDFASSTAGMTAYDDEGKRSVVSAQFKVEIKRTTAAGGGNYFDTWRQLPDPAGSRNKPFKKNANEFEWRGDSTSQLFFALSIRGVIRKMLQKNKNSTVAKWMDRDFTRAKYDVRVTRTNSVKADTNSLFYDELFLTTYDEVIDEWLSYPGVALLSIQAVASEKLNGSAPNITCRVIGKADVQAHDGTSWASGATNQGNPVWAAIDLITNKRYGSGEQYTLAANIDATSAKAAADHCAESVTLPNGGTETRNELDIIVDTRKSPIAWAMDLLRPARIWPVMQGNVWKFVIDEAVTLSSVPTVWEDTRENRVARDSQRLGHETIAREPTELQVSFLDVENDFDRKEVWIAPTSPASDRRIERTEAYGVVRRSEATRYANAVYTQMRAGGLNLSFSYSPKGLVFEPGDVFRFRSSARSLDAYYRVFRMSWSTTDYFVQIEAIPYISAVYSQADGAQQTRRGTPIKDRIVQGGTTTIRDGDSRRKTRRMGARARRVA